MSTLAQPAPLVRTGTCRLQLQIDQAVYSVRRRPGTAAGAKHWHLKKLAGPRAGAVYVLTAHK